MCWMLSVALSGVIIYTNISKVVLLPFLGIDMCLSGHVLRSCKCYGIVVRTSVKWAHCVRTWNMSGKVRLNYF